MLRHARRSLTTLAVLAAAAATPALAAAAPFTAHFHAADHAPKANVGWPVTVTATKGSKKLSGTVRYEFLLGTQVVSRQPGGPFKKGHYRDVMTFPAEAVGHPLILRAVVTTSYGTVRLPWKVTVRQ